METGAALTRCKWGYFFQLKDTITQERNDLSVEILSERSDNRGAACRRCLVLLMRGGFRRCLELTQLSPSNNICPCGAEFKKKFWTLDFAAKVAMVKSYNKYEADQSFGLVNSPASNVLSVQNGSSRISGAGLAVVGANEEVFRWDLKKGELLSRWRDSACTAQVTTIARSGVDRDLYAIGSVQHTSKFFTKPCPLY
jgi:hypothetical protein